MVSRAEAIATLQEARAAVYDRVGKLSSEEVGRPGTIGEWSVADLIGHLGFWEELALEAIDARREGRKPRAEEIFDADTIDQANAEDVARKRTMSFEEVQRASDQTHRALLSAVESLSDDDWSQKARYEAKRKRALGELLGAITGAPKGPFGHALAHLDDLEALVSG